nr:F0F1 ATP synthase subunit epsilon [uncultured Desulfuromonas sp.]
MMKLNILLPSRIFATYDDVHHLMVETPHGALGFLPRRRDCITPLSAGILTYRHAQGGNRYVATDTGILVKTGLEVAVSVRHAVASDNLEQLQQIVRDEFLQLTEREQNVRLLFAKIESGFIRRLAEYRHD